MDIVRYRGGGMVRSVRGVTGPWYSYFDVEGNYAAFMDFESGATALVYSSAYGHFTTGPLPDQNPRELHCTFREYPKWFRIDLDRSFLW
jgi:hypothetical protein